jgi:hypothetical protein
VPLGWLNRARQGAQEHTVVADDGHLGALHRQGDPLPGQLEADVDLSAVQPG